MRLSWTTLWLLVLPAIAVQARMHRRADGSWPRVARGGHPAEQLPSEPAGDCNAEGARVVTKIVTVTATADVTVTKTVAQPSATSSGGGSSIGSSSISSSTKTDTRPTQPTDLETFSTITNDQPSKTGTITGSGTGTGSGASNTKTSTGTGTTSGGGHASTNGTSTDTGTSTSTSTSGPKPNPSGANSPAGKKGIDYNNAALLAPFAGKVGWAANWEQTMEGVPKGMHYYPMLWNHAEQRTARWSATAQAAIDRGDNVLLGFNEPQADMCERQACMDVALAVRTWNDHMKPWKAKGATLVSPSITQAEIGTKWLSDFLQACPPADCKIDAIALHWYEGAHQIEYFKKYLSDASTNPAYKGLPIYVTEFAPTSGTDAEKATFIKAATKWMDDQAFIKGYALHWAEDATSNGQLNAVGSAYIA